MAVAGGLVAVAGGLVAVAGGLVAVARAMAVAGGRAQNENASATTVTATSRIRCGQLTVLPLTVSQYRCAPAE